MNLNEQWVEIEDFSRYLVSDHGRVMNRTTERILKPGNNGNGYLYVVLYDEFGPHNRYIHRLVAQHFLSGGSDELEVNHRGQDGDKSNNHASNLEWATREANIQHAYANGLNSPTRRGNVRSIEIIETGEIFESAAACARAIGGRQSTIHKLVNGIGKSHLGYTFRYVDL